MGKIHPPDRNLQVTVNKTSILSDDRTTFLKPFQNILQVDSHIFKTTDQDELIGASIEDDAFLKIMDAGMVKDSDDRWIAPLPFRDKRPTLENNRQLAMKSAKSFHNNLKFNTSKQEHVKQFMAKIIENLHSPCRHLRNVGTYRCLQFTTQRNQTASELCFMHQLYTMAIR